MNTRKLTFTLISLLLITGCATQQASPGYLKLNQQTVAFACRAGTIEVCQLAPIRSLANQAQASSCTCVFPEAFHQSPATSRGHRR